MPPAPLARSQEYNDPNDELLDKALADKTLTYLVGDVWLLAEPFVLWMRHEYGIENAYDEWERMYHARTQSSGG